MPRPDAGAGAGDDDHGIAEIEAAHARCLSFALLHVSTPSTYKSAAHQAPYCSSLTCSIQSTTLPSRASWMARCVIEVVRVAPCQCFSPGGNQTTSPGSTSSTGPPQVCTHPRPDMTINV